MTCFHLFVFIVQVQGLPKFYVIMHFANVAFVSLIIPQFQRVGMSYPHVADDRGVRNDPKPVCPVIKKPLECCEGQSGVASGQGRNQSARIAGDQYYGQQAGCELQRAAGAISRHHVRTCGYDVTAEHICVNGKSLCKVHLASISPSV